jgi:DNA-binding GntR family transcriptional regulator
VVVSRSQRKLDPVSLAAKVAGHWRSEILSGRLKPGSRLPLEHYKSWFSVSSTPLRDASKMLEAEGLLRIAPRRGVFVADVNVGTLLDAYEIRIALEPLVVSLATPLIPLQQITEIRRAYEAASGIARKAERSRRLLDVDRGIHDIVLEFCPNARLTKIMTDNSSYVDWCRDIVARRVKGSMEPTISEHLAICDAIIARDATDAANRMREHLIATKGRILASPALRRLTMPTNRVESI